MAADVIRLDIVTPAGIVFSDAVSTVQVPSALGLMGILANHAPLMTTLEIGAIKYTKEDKEHYLAVSGGFLEVKDNVVIILATSAEKAEDIDIARAINAKERAEERLVRKDDAELDVLRAELALKRSINRIHVAELKK
ncbi:MAG: F0F1 ATP synthase subunit epsilon [Clostridia bacterium]|nr:F0F1 ATP synthase subunit epsilon [Clostridia bacterium]